MKIYAPVENTNGVRASVRFVNGVGETDNPRLIEWFEDHGYRLEKCAEIAQNSLEKCEKVVTNDNREVEVDLESMTPNELRDYAKSIGLGGLIKNTRNKEKLIELIRG